MNEPQFQGHFPDLPVMPGVLIIEAMAQACGTLAILSEGGRKENEFFFFAGIDDARFETPSHPRRPTGFEVELLTNNAVSANSTPLPKSTAKLPLKP